MSIDITVKIGGEAGQGIQTVGDLLSLVCRKAGLYLMAVNDFESRIRGGHSFLLLRISDRPVQAPNHDVNLLVALNKDTYERHKDEILPGGKIIIEDNVGGDNVIQVGITDLAKEAGGAITSNTVAAGACLSLIGAPFELLKGVLAEHFGGKKQEIVDQNITAAQLGFDAVKDVSFEWTFDWTNDAPKGILLDGSRGVAYGAIAADCRVAAFYPMSPATSILGHLSNLSDNFPIVVEQVEDEIAAINMIIGASFAGVRALTATSGGGFALMTEGLGLAAITETPIVIVNAQRPGPATGLPTRTAQGDLRFVLHAAPDEFPRFVFAPGDPFEAFQLTVRAFHLAEKYQVPAIILMDQYLNDSIFLAEEPLTPPEKIERFLSTDDDLENPDTYKRFAYTDSGVSPRVVPCAGKALLVATGNEHREDGHTTEVKEIRTGMVDKRNAKIPAMIEEMNPPEAYYGDSETLLVAWGSSKGAVKEAVDKLQSENMDVGCLIFTDIWPFPAEKVEKALSKTDRFFIVEGNSMAQLGHLIQEQTCLKFSESILKYDGRPFYPIEIVNAVKEYLR